MIINLNDLNSKNNFKYEINSEIDIDDETIKNTDIRRISPVKVIGYLLYNGNNYELNVNISGEMILPCARTLNDVSHPFNIDIDEIFDENDDFFTKTSQNTLDIFPIIWQNILMDIPLRVLSNDANTLPKEGDGWHLVSEDEKKIDPRLKDLSKFIKE